MKHSDAQFIKICQNSITMSEAARELGLTLKAFRKRAKSLGVYKPNPGARGGSKSNNSAYPLEKIFTNELPMQSFKLKLKLFASGLKENVCEICGISEWNGQELKCHLDHIDGNKDNNEFENLRIICPNCHSQTDTFCFKMGRKYRQD